VPGLSKVSGVFVLHVGLNGLDWVIDIVTHILIFLRRWTQTIMSCFRRVRKIAEIDH
jgi:hypothetical protein